ASAFRSALLSRRKPRKDIARIEAYGSTQANARDAPASDHPASGLLRERSRAASSRVVRSCGTLVVIPECPGISPQSPSPAGERAGLIAALLHTSACGRAARSSREGRRRTSESSTGASESAVQRPPGPPQRTGRNGDLSETSSLGRADAWTKTRVLL